MDDGFRDLSNPDVRAEIRAKAEEDARKSLARKIRQSARLYDLDRETRSAAHYLFKAWLHGKES